MNDKASDSITIPNEGPKAPYIQLTVVVKFVTGNKENACAWQRDLVHDGISMPGVKYLFDFMWGFLRDSFKRYEQITKNAGL